MTDGPRDGEAPQVPVGPDAAEAVGPDPLQGGAAAVGPAAGGDDLAVRTVDALKWTYAAAIAKALMQVAYTATMSRILSDRAFGIVALAQLVANFSLWFAQMGIGQAIVQRRALTSEQIRAGFWASALAGVAVTVVLVLAAPAIAGVFDEPQVQPVLRVLAFVFVLTGLSSPARSLLRRALRFKELAAIEATAYAVGYLGVGVGVALLGGGVWSLVAAEMSAHVIELVWRYAVVRHPLRPVFERAHYGVLFGFGVRLTLINFGDWLGNNLPAFAVGRFATAALLGQFNRGFLLVTLPLDYLTMSLTNVLFPGLSRMQDDPDRMQRVYVGVAAVAGVLLVPICVGLAAASTEVVRVVLGPQWDVAAQVVPFLAVAAAANVLTRLVSLVYDARGALGTRLTVQGTYVVVLVAVLAAVGGRPIWVLAAVYAAGEIIRHLVYLAALRSVLGLSFVPALLVYLPVGVASVVVGAAVAAARVAAMAGGSPLLVVFLAEVGAGGVGLVLSLRLPPLAGVRTELRQRLQSAGLLTPGSRVATVVVAFLPIPGDSAGADRGSGDPG